MYGWSINIGPSAINAGSRDTGPHGLLSGTPVASEHGWRPVEALRPGDRVWTFDDGLKPIRTITPRRLWANPEETGPEAYSIPAGAIGNETELVLLGSEGLLLECENASDAIGDPFAVIPVAALGGVCGIEKIAKPAGRILHTLAFDAEVALYIDSGLILHCPTSQQAARYDVKSVEEAKALLTDLDIGELALREPDEDFLGELASARVA